MERETPEEGSPSAASRSGDAAPELWTSWHDGRGAGIDEVIARADELEPWQLAVAVCADQKERWRRSDGSGEDLP